MEQRIRESFYLIWLAAIAVCCAVAVFALVFASCTKGGGNTGSAPRGDTAAPAIVGSGDDEVVIFPAAEEMPAETATYDTEETAPAESTPAESTPAESTPAEETSDDEIIFDAEEIILPEPDETIAPEPQG